MMIDGQKRLYYSDNILVRIEPGVRQAVAEAAAREQTTMAEIIRRGLRAAVSQYGTTVERNASQTVSGA